MRCARLRKFLIVLLTGGFMYGSVSCYPTHDQINATLAGGLMNGLELAITLGIENLFSNAVGGLSVPNLLGQNSTQTTTDQTTTTQ